jgi:hypothetical protein
MFDARIRFVYLCPLFLFGTVWLFQNYWQPAQPNNDYDPSLYKLAYRLHNAGLEFRAVSPRRDGLLTNALYLTQTDLDDVSIRTLVLDPSQIQKWHGTVKVFFEADPQFHLCVFDDWNECSYRYGKFVFFGDKELLDEIASRLGSANAAKANATPPRTLKPACE